MFWKGVVGYLPVNVAQGVVGLLTIVLFTRLLSPADYGAYALGFSVMSLAHTSLFTWTEAAMARFWAARDADGRRADHMATLQRAWIMVAVGFPLIAAGIVAVVGHGPVMGALVAGLAAIPARSATKLCQERLRAAGEVSRAAMLDIVQTLGGFAIGACLAAAHFGGASPLIGLGAISALSLPFVLPRELKLAKAGRFDAALAKGYLAYGLPVSLSLILGLVLATTDRFLLAAFLNETAVGVYHAGYSLANRTLDVMFIWLGMAGGPAMVAALERGGHKALTTTAREQAGLMALLAIPAATGLALVARPLAEVMIGPELRAGAAQVTPWIALSAVLAGVTTYYFHQAFTLGKRTQLLFVAMIAPAAANFLLNLVLIPRFGLNGALWATPASYGLGLVCSWTLGRRACPLPLPWDALWRAAISAAVMAIAVAALPALGGILELALKAGVGGLVYGVCAVALDAGGLRGRALDFLQTRRARMA